MILVMKRWPSETRSISIAIVSTACSSRSRRWDASNHPGGMTGRAARRHITFAADIASGPSTKMMKTIEMPVIWPGFTNGNWYGVPRDVLTCVPSARARPD